MTFYFANFSDFLAMGKHGLYVWMSYALVFAVLLFLALRPSWQLKQIKKQYVSAQKRKQLGAQGKSISVEGEHS